MPKQVLTRRRSWTARIAVLAVAFSLLAVALPASAHSVAIDTSVSCPSTTPSGGFTDIGAFGADVQLAINCLKAFGITQGTTATTYSPNDIVARWQMALFLVRQAAAHGIVVPAPTSQGYTDISGLPQATQDAINQVTQLGISKGTTSSTFSPNDGVTRWQMALFLHRLAVRAGVTVTDDPAHNQFTDIGAYTAEIQAAINFLADGHIALGVGGSIYDGNSFVTRWQMALFLTRVLAADGIVQPGSRVAVSPTASAAQGTGTARTYTATFRNTDGSAFTGRVGIQLVEATDAGAPIYNDVADFVNIESVSDALVINAGGDTATGVAGSDGVVTFTIRHAGTGEDTIPVAWIDSDLDGTYESTGNSAPTEPFGLGGETDFAAGAAGEAVAGAIAGTVSKTTKASDVFELNPSAGASCVTAPCSFFYDSGDVFTVDGSAATLQAFEDALSVGDTVAGTYDPDTADQSTFNLTNVAPTTPTVTDPAAATTVDAASYSIKGTAHPGAAIRIRQDVDGDNVRDAEDGIVATGTADADGAWTVVTPLAQGVANNFLASQVPSGSVTESASVDVPTITEGASAGATFTSSVGANGGTAGVLDPGDTITITFSENLSGVGSGDTITVLDVDGTTGTITAGTNATFGVAANVLTVTITAVVPTTGTADGVEPPATITAVGGFTDDDGEAINVTSNPAGRTFTGF